METLTDTTKLFTPAIITISSFLLVNVLVFYFFYNSSFQAAKITLVLGIDIAIVIITAFIFGLKPGLHFYLLLFSVVPLPIWTYRKRTLSLLFLLFNILVFIYIEAYMNPKNVLIDFPDVLVKPFQISSIVISLLIIFYVLWKFYDISFENEKKLYKANYELENSHKKINLQRDELLELSVQLKNNLKELTDKKEKLQEINATKDKFFSIIAHDLKSPLNSMLGFSDLLNTHFDRLDEFKKKKYINLINQTGTDLYKLLDNLLQWSSVQTGIMPYKPTTFYLLDAVKPTADLLKPIAEEKNLTIHNKINRSTHIYADFSMITTILRNLLSNAIKYSNNDGNIWIEQTESEKEVKVLIKDEGIGIKKEHVANLFLIEHSYSKRGTSGEKGTGLGLIICKEFITMNDGNIGVESIANKGSTFWFTLRKQKLNTYFF